MSLTEELHRWGFEGAKKLANAKTVIVALSLTRRKDVAIKVINKANTSPGSVKRHLEIASVLQHEHIVKTLEAHHNPSVACIVMEYCHFRDLYNYLSDKNPLVEDEARKLFFQLARAVDYMHNTANVAHRNIASCNILLDRDMNLKLANFSRSCQRSCCKTCVLFTLDVFYMGFVLHHMLSKKPIQSIREVDKLSVSAPCKQLLKDLFLALKRTTKEVLSHEWLRPEHRRKKKSEASGT